MSNNSQIQVQCSKCQRTYNATVGSYDKRHGWVCPDCRDELNNQQGTGRKWGRG